MWNKFSNSVGSIGHYNKTFYTRHFPAIFISFLLMWRKIFQRRSLSRLALSETTSSSFDWFQLTATLEEELTVINFVWIIIFL